MTEVNLTLPESLQVYVENRVAHGEFATPADYLRTLIRRDQEQRVAFLETEMLEALAGGRVEVTRDELTAGKLVETLRTKLMEKTRG